MSIATGANATAANFNAAFASKTSVNTLAEVQTMEKQVVIKEIATPSTPSSGYGAVYFKTDGELYVKNDAGTESKVSNQASSTGAPTIQKFTSGSGTYTTPANVLYLRVTMVGAGGGGGGSGTSAGGTGGTGGNSTFGTTLLVANGGVGGTFATNSDGTGGTASLGTGPIGIALSGGYGLPGGYTEPAGGGGGVSPFGGAGKGGHPSAVNSGFAAISNSGSGGGGASYTPSNGASGNGGGAGGYVCAIISSPSATYSYSVGAAGTAGTAGTGGAAGGAGGSGYIIVEEFYG